MSEITDNQVSLGELITQKYDFSQLQVDDRMFYEEENGILNSQDTLSWMLQYRMPECVRKIDDLHYYLVYQLNSGGTLYQFYTRSQDTIVWYQCSAYSEKALSYSDFEKIEVGASIDKVAKIDPAAATINEYYRNNFEYVKSIGYKDIRMLADGVMIIRYEPVNEGQSYQVSNIEYFNDCIIKYTGQGISGFGDYTINCKILEQDYPK